MKLKFLDTDGAKHQKTLRQIQCAPFVAKEPVIVNGNKSVQELVCKRYSSLIQVGHQIYKNDLCSHIQIDTDNKTRHCLALSPPDTTHSISSRVEFRMLMDLDGINEVKLLSKSVCSAQPGVKLKCSGLYCSGAEVRVGIKCFRQHLKPQPRLNG